MRKELKILCIHGIGGQDATIASADGWAYSWRNELKKNLAITTDENIHFMEFDKYFKSVDANWNDYAVFFYKTFLGKLFRRKAAKGILKNWMDNYPDMVIEFLIKMELRKKLRADLLNHLVQNQPDIIYAHSLGSLICYDFFSQPENQKGYEHLTLVTAGSQLGRAELGSHGIIIPIARIPVKKWFNLNNDFDRVLAKRNINVIHDNFIEIETPFKDKLFNHNGLHYLKHKSAIANVWNSFKQ